MSARFSAAISLLLHCNGSNGATTFTDSSLAHLAVTPSNSAQISTAQSKFGGASGLFAGSGSTSAGDYLTTAVNSALTFGTTDFTISFWLRMTALPTTSAVLLDGRPALTNGLYAALYVTSAGVLTYHVNSVDRITGGTLSTDTWYHIEICRVNGSTRLLIDGVQSGSTYADSTSYADTRFVIGASGYHTSPTGQFGLNGNIDDLRIIKYLGLHDATFTPPTAAYDDPGIDAEYTLFNSLAKVVGPTLAFPGANPTGKTLNATPLRANTKPLLVPAVLLQFRGSKKIAGTVKVITTPAPSRLVRLYDKLSGKLVQETLSDSSGLYAFNSLDGTRTYFVTAFDNAGGYNATIEDAVTPG